MVGIALIILTFAVLFLLLRVIALERKVGK